MLSDRWCLRRGTRNESSPQTCKLAAGKGPPLNPADCCCSGVLVFGVRAVSRALQAGTDAGTAAARPAMQARLTSGARGWRPGPGGRSRSHPPGSRPGRRGTQRLRQPGEHEGGLSAAVDAALGRWGRVEWLCQLLPARRDWQLKWHGKKQWDEVWEGMQGPSIGSVTLRFSSARMLRQQLDRQCVLSWGMQHISIWLG